MSSTLLLNTTSRHRKKSIETAARLILKGKLIAFPTETVYGLGANVYDRKAVRRIFRVKGRPSDNPLIVHIWSLEQLSGLVGSIPVMFWVLANKFMPGPLTVVMRKSKLVPREVAAGLDTVAIRMPDHPVALELLKHAGVPIVAPSANLSGRPSPTAAHHVKEDLDGIPAILDGGPCRIGIESTVLDLTSKFPTILRPGGVTREELERVLRMRVRVARPTQEKPLSPGMKYRHYSPKAEVILFEGSLDRILKAMKTMSHELALKKIRTGIMVEEKKKGILKGAEVFSLGKESVESAARKIFDGFRTLDKKGVKVILCQGFPEEKLGHAVMNRLRKAATRRVRV